MGDVFSHRAEITDFPGIYHKCPEGDGNVHTRKRVNLASIRDGTKGMGR